MIGRLAVSHNQRTSCRVDSLVLMNRRRGARIAGAIVALVILVLGGQAVLMHRDSGEWRDSVAHAESNPRSPGRYVRSNLGPVDLPAGYEAHRSTKGRGTVYIPSDALSPPVARWCSHLSSTCASAAEARSSLAV